MTFPTLVRPPTSATRVNGHTASIDDNERIDNADRIIAFFMKMERWAPYLSRADAAKVADGLRDLASKIESY